MEIEAITTAEGWARLEAAWDPLVERSASASIFLTWEWLWPWWRCFRRPGDELFVLAAWDAASGDCRLPSAECRVGPPQSAIRNPQSGRLIGLAPLYRSRVRAAHRLGSLRRIGFIGDHSCDSEYLDFIIEPGREAEVLAAFLDSVARDPRGWDLLQLSLLPTASPNHALLRGLAAERGWAVESWEWPCLAIRLPGDWESYLRTLQPRFRSKLRSLGRRLREGRGAAFEQCTDAAELPARLESLFELHQRRWRAAGKAGSFAGEARRRFYREMGEAFLRRGWLRFHSLRLEGAFAAHEFSFEHLGRVYFLQQAYDIEREELNPGTALKAHVIRESIGRGAREYDFLGGDAPYKRQWGAERRSCTFLTLARPAASPRVHLWLRRAAQRVRDRARALTPEPLLRLKRRVQARLKKPPKATTDSTDGHG